jgi:hypothetical protein
MDGILPELLTFRACMDLQPDKLGSFGCCREEDGKRIFHRQSIAGFLVVVGRDWACFKESGVLVAEDLV